MKSFSRHAKKRKKRNIAGRFFSLFEQLTLKQLLISFFVLIIFFGFLYNIFSYIPGNGLMGKSGLIKPGLEGIFDSIYFSAVTTSSLGYGDIAPMGLSRILIMFEVLLGLLFIGAFASKIISVKQDMMLEEVYKMSLDGQIRSLRSTLFLYRKDLEKSDIANPANMKILTINIRNIIAEMKVFFRRILKDNPGDHKIYIDLTLESINDTLKKIADKSTALKIPIERDVLNEIRLEVNEILRLVERAGVSQSRARNLEETMKLFESIR
ncbi:MAG: two pore domain potassium channel family protein [Candidatus Aenigmarchaeota archaeon]|nr:two pore domain potassium channel family protein [Candidatus Aenigmarchaeota archaeon]